MEKSALQNLVQSARKGDQDAIDKLYEDTKSYAYCIAQKYLQNDADAQDVLQEAYNSAFEKLDTIEGEMSFKPWLHKIVLNKCRDLFKRNRAKFVPMDEIAELAAESEEVLPAEWLEKAERRRDIMRLIDGLPEGQRLAILLHYMDGLTIAEIADVMGIAEGSVKSHLHRGKQAIKAAVLLEEKKGNKLYALVPMPMLAEVFELEAEATVIPEAVSKAVWEGVRKNLIENGIIKSTLSTLNEGAHTTGTEANPTNTGQQASNAGANAVNSSTTASNGGLNSPSAGARAADAGAHAGMETANKGGLLKMFLGLSTGKKVGVIAAALAVLIGLSLLCSALAAPTPTPTLGGVIAEATPTPTPGIGAQPPPGRDGPDGPGGGGAKPGDSDGPSGTGKPEATAPPKKETPPEGEDNTPWEAEPDGSGKPVKPKKAKVKKMTTTWTIKADGTYTNLGWVGNESRMDWIATMKFEAVKQGGNTEYGAYKGVSGSSVDMTEDSSKFIAYLKSQSGGGGSLIREYQAKGPLTNIEFTLDPPLAPLVKEDEELAPLVPPTMVEGGGTMHWAPAPVRNHYESPSGSGILYPEGFDQNCTIKITIYEGGSGVMKVLFPEIPKGWFIFPVRLSKSVKLVDVA